MPMIPPVTPLFHPKLQSINVDFRVNDPGQDGQ